MNYMMTTESDDGMDSSTYDESPAAGKSRGKGSGLKKGPWTSAEDRILIDYVKKHGEGNWNALQRHTSLSRCGKSCRLRWANHLRPNLKKGAFSPEEEELIVEMHAKIGNKWAQMAEHLPGRTDNEIKNYWNTRIKRRHRAGLPLYHSDIHAEDLQWCEEYTKRNTLRVSRRRRHQDFLQLGNSKADVLLDDLNFASSLPGASDLSDLVACSMLGTGASTSLYESYMPPILPSPKPLRESGSRYPRCSSSIKLEFQSPEQFQNTAPQKNSSYCSISPCDVDHPPFGNQYSSDMMIPETESHTFTDGMLPTSKPSFGAVKLELPSFQYSETSGFDQWKMTPSPPHSDLLDSVDAYLQSPPPSEIEESDCFSSCDTGLLDMLLYEAKIKTSAKHSSLLSSSDQSFGSTTCRTNVTGNAPRGHETQTKSGEFEDSDENLAFSGIPVPTQFDAGRISSGNVDVKTEELDQVWEPKRIDITRPDVLLASSWLDHGCFGFVGDSTSMTDALALLLGGDDIGNSYMTGSSSSQAPGGVESCAWTNMPPVWSL